MYHNIFYFEGKYVKYNISKAIDYFLKAAKFYKNAQFMLGIIYLLGVDVEKDIKKSIYYLSQSANNGFQEAQFIMAYFYQEGKLVKRDIKKAIKLYKEVSSFNNQFAKNNLGVIYKNVFEDDVKQNVGLSIEYFKEAISQKNENLAKFNLSIIYLYDEPFMNSIDKSINLLIDLIDTKIKSSKILLCLALIKKFGFQINSDDIKQELLKYKDDPNYMIIEISKMIVDMELNNPIIYEQKSDYYKNHFLLYDYKKMIVSLQNLMKTKLFTDTIDNQKINEINSLFYEGFGIDLN